MNFTQIRHATCIIEFGNTRFLVDPILYKNGTLDPVKGGIDCKNPLTDINVLDDVIKNIDVILLTHTHKDHFDPSIVNFFDIDIPIVCAIDYKKQLKELGFRNVRFVTDKIEICDIEIILVKGKHGKGIVGKLMGNSYGFMLKSQSDGVVYVTGDTVWCKCIEEAIGRYSPNYIVAFAGSAMIKNKHITLDADDISTIFTKSPNSKVIAIHMEAWNHCCLMRSDLLNTVPNTNLYVPKDGETLKFQD